LVFYGNGVVTPETRATLVAGLFAGVPAVVLGAVAALVAGPMIGVIVLVVVGVALGGWARFGGERRVLASIGGRDADPVSDARLCNLAEGLSMSAGVRQPRLVVLDSPGLNAMAVGIRPSRAVVGVTAGLLSELDRIELEAVLAEELIQIRRHETLPATVLVGTFGIGRTLALQSDRDAQMDLAAVALTRYPPALAAALEKLDAKGAAVAGQPASMAHLWLADPSLSPVARRGRLTLRERVEALREL
jgi:heat shock protein HtpX